MTTPTAPAYDPVPAIARELGLPAAKVASAVLLFSGGATVPFVARYRKEATGGLDEVELRRIAERGEELQRLEERRRTIRQSIADQGRLDDDLARRLAACTTRAELEDLYLPFRPKKRTRASVARERGLEPIAERILAQPTDGDPEAEAAAFVNPEKEVADTAAALAGARDIVAERVAEDAAVRGHLRRRLLATGRLTSSAAKKDPAKTKFDEYKSFREPVAKIASHRYLAIRRGEKNGVLRVAVELTDSIQPWLLEHLGHVDGSPFGAHLDQAAADAVKRLLLPSVTNEVRNETKERADRVAVDIFAGNLRSLLLSPPLGPRPVIGIDPGLRTGCKCVALDATGRTLEHRTVQPWTEAGRPAATTEIVAMARALRPAVIAVGNGTGGRETEAFVREALRLAGLGDIAVCAVNEAGASVYSASELARAELPDLDVSVRGAVSIGRRLQDPLAELVKIEPKSIGVGQYQHDVHQPLLRRKLSEVVESCVNQVGVEINTASPELLSEIAGIGPKLARSIVAHRDQHGRFTSRAQLGEVAGLGPKVFEQAAGFLRLADGEEPLDRSAVHPERYALVERMASDLGVTVKDLVGAPELARRVEIDRYVGDDVGRPTLEDIVAELERPGRDPRDTFEPPRFRDDIRAPADLREGMTLEGVVTNVTAFGAFVDVGVHQDGLVHVSQLADRFVSDPSEVVQVGKKVEVRVLGVDLERKRIALTMRSDTSERPARSAAAGKPERAPGEGRPQRRARGPKRGGGKPTSGKPTGGKPTGGKPGAGKRGGGKPTGGKRAGGKPAASEPTRRAERDESSGSGFRNNPFEVLKKR